MKKNIKAVFTVIDDDKLDKPIFQRIGTGFVNSDQSLNVIPGVAGSGKKEAA